MSLFKHKIKEANFPEEWMDNKPYIPVPKRDWIEKKYLDVPYGASLKQKIDIYYPNENLHQLEKFPVLFIIHGGGFGYMDKADWHVYPGFFWLQKGYMVVSINYRLAPADKYPAAVDDSLTAVQYVINNAEEYLVDVKNIFIMGASAGGNLTLTTGLQLFNKQEKSNYEIKGLAPLCPVTDITSIWFDSQDKTMKYSFLARTMTKKTIMDYIGTLPTSTSFQPYDASYYLLDKIPPIYFQLGEFDPIIKLDFVKKYAESLKTKGECVVDVIEGGAHMGATKHFFLTDKIMGYLNFFEKKITK